MMEIIAVTGFKGGCGKTTIAMNLAGALIEHNQSVLVVDADPQGSSLAWAAAARLPGFPTVIGLPKPILHRPEQVPALAQNYQFTLIDCPPANNEIVQSALAAATVALLPVTPSPLDIWSATSFVRLIQDARVTNGRLAAFLLLSRRKPNTSLGVEGKASLELYGLPVLNTEIFERIDLQKAVMAGMAVTQYEPKGKSAHEFQTLAKEIIDYAERKTKTAIAPAGGHGELGA
jgi:chromosome partitioning protein